MKKPNDSDLKNLVLKRSLLIVTGCPGTGKTTFSRYLSNKLNYTLLSLDDIKETIFEEIGFENIEEKRVIENNSFNLFYSTLHNKMEENENIIIEYPFYGKHINEILRLLDLFKLYEPITIRLEGNLDALYNRYIMRDLYSKRHIGHISDYYKNGMSNVENKGISDLLITFDQFKENYFTKKYGEFQIGELIKIDVSDYSKVNYDDINLEKYSLLSKCNIDNEETKVNYKNSYNKKF